MQRTVFAIYNAVTALGVKADFYAVFVGSDGVLSLVSVTRLAFARYYFVNLAFDSADTLHGVGNPLAFHAALGAVCNMPKRTAAASRKGGATVILSVGGRRNYFLNFRNRIFFVNLYNTDGKSIAKGGPLYKNGHAVGVSNARALGGHAVNRYRN